MAARTVLLLAIAGALVALSTASSTAFSTTFSSNVPKGTAGWSISGGSDLINSTYNPGWMSFARKASTSYGVYVVKARMPSSSDVTFTMTLKGSDKSEIYFQRTGGDSVVGGWKTAGGKTPPAHTVCSPHKLPADAKDDLFTYTIAWDERQIEWNVSHPTLHRPIMCSAISSQAEAGSSDKIPKGPLTLELRLEGDNADHLDTVELVSAAFVAVVDHPRISFHDFVREYNKSYESEQEMWVRYEIFVDNLAFVEAFEHPSYTLGINEYSDLTQKEMATQLTGAKADTSGTPVEIESSPSATHGTKCPSNGHEFTCDWRRAGVVNHIKNQGQCGCCWAFSTTASIEGAHALHTKRLVSLSEQNLVDCSRPEGNLGCNGGFQGWAYNYVIKNKGIDSESSYPFHAKDGSCHYSAAHKEATISSWKQLPAGSEAHLLTAVEKVGPIAVSICDASGRQFQSYKSGVFHFPECGNTLKKIDHAVTVVGYGETGGKKFWLVRNQWGTSWGEKGYIYMARDAHDQCGIALQAVYPVI